MVSGIKLSAFHDRALDAGKNGIQQNAQQSSKERKKEDESFQVSSGNLSISAAGMISGVEISSLHDGALDFGRNNIQQNAQQSSKERKTED